MKLISLKDIKLENVRVEIFLICLVGFIWALMETVSQSVAVNYSLYQVVWVRYAVHLLFIILVFVPRYGRHVFLTQKIGLQVLRAVMMLIMPVSFIFAANYMPVHNILWFFWLAPVMIILLSIAFMKEGINWRYWAVAGLGLGCVTTLIHPDQSLTPAGIALSLTMGLSFSLYLVMTRMLREELTITNLFYTAVGVLIPLSFKLPAFWKPLSLQAGLWMAFVGILGFVLLWVLDKVLDMTSAAVVAPFLYLQMFWIVVFKLILRIL